MVIFDVTFGELMSAKEVCEATGFTMNQLRNWRLPSRVDKAPFGYVSIGTSPFYRKASVQLWLDQNSGSNVRYVPAGTDLDVPISSVFEGDVEKVNALKRVAVVTPENVKSWQDYLFGVDQKRTMESSNPVKNRFLSELLGVEVGFGNSVSADQRFSSPEWFTAMVWALRLQLNEMYGLGLSDEEVLAIPVGQVPPVRESKK
jgi:hypothetical protein